MNGKILITGGACAGKTEIVKDIKEKYEKKGHNVFILKEVPTFLIAKGIIPEEIGKEAFIKLVINTYIHIENIYNNILQKYKSCLMIYDGSSIDTLKFINPKVFEEIVNKRNTSFSKIINQYDKIIFLETIAKKEPKLYTTQNNKARLNDIDKAIERNDTLFQYYKNNCNYIEGTKNIEVKKNKVYEIIEEAITKMI